MARSLGILLVLLAALGAAKKTRVERKCEGRDAAIVAQLYERALNQTNEGWEKMKMIKDARRWCSENGVSVKDYKHCLPAIVNEHVWRREDKRKAELVREINDLNPLEQTYARQALELKRDNIARFEKSIRHVREHGLSSFGASVKEYKRHLQEARTTIPDVKLGRLAINKVGCITAYIRSVDSKTTMLVEVRTYPGPVWKPLYVSGMVGHFVVDEPFTGGPIAPHPGFPSGLPLIITGTRDGMFLAEPADIDLRKIERWVEYYFERKNP